MLPEVGGMPYIAFLAAGTVCYSTMNSASFEALYSGFARMHEQRTWEAILNTPITLDDIVFSEIVWGKQKACSPVWRCWRSSGCWDCRIRR